jgi:FlaA1/EpsC-like NDP-sugar epimerase
MKNFRKFTDWYFSRKSLPYWCIFWIDCAVIFISYLFIYQQINSGAKALGILGQLSMLFAIFTLFHAIGFRIFHTYDGILRYSSFIDLQRVFYAVVSSCNYQQLTIFFRYNHAGRADVIWPWVSHYNTVSLF